MSVAASLSIDWRWRRFGQLSGDEVYDLLGLRSAIFVVEQGCVFLDADGVDRSAWHLLGTLAHAHADADANGGRALVAYLRCIDPGVRYDEPSIGRVVVAERLRRTGVGRVLMDEGIARSRAAWPGASIVIGAQQRLEAFYASLGFAVEGVPYEEDGIDHVKMRLPAA